MNAPTAVENQELKLESEGIRKLASVYHAINHPTRLVIINLIHKHGAMSVLEISDKMQLDKETVSQQLGILRRAELVRSIPRSRFRYYSLNYKILGRLHYQFDY
jgi:ArsR family transcriptional regulator, virulence genes transcriptional regulator